MPMPAAVPWVSTPHSTWLTASATPLRMAWWHLASGTFNSRPLASVTLVSTTGSQYLPRAPKAAYAAARRSGETVLGPSVKEATCCSGLPSARRMPSFSAIFTVSQSPTCFSRLRKKVLTEFHVPVTRLNDRPPSPSAALLSDVLDPAYLPSQLRRPVGA